jgi:predicted O-methyltransferase YrrM
VGLQATPETDAAFPTRRLAVRARRGIARYGLTGFATKSAIRPLRPALAPVAGRRLRRQAERAEGQLERLVGVAFGCKPFEISVEPGQQPAEIQALLERLAAEQPRRVLEIGTANGGSLFLVSHVLSAGAHLISVDLPDGEFGGGYPAWKIPLYRSFVPREHRLDLIRADSHAQESVDRVRALLNGRQLDFLFIDGDHTYEGVRQDFDLYSPLVRRGGLIGFHDITPAAADGPADGSELLVGDVPRFWREIRERYPSEELVDDAAGGWFGIGLIRV